MNYSDAKKKIIFSNFIFLLTLLNFSFIAVFSPSEVEAQNATCTYPNENYTPMDEQLKELLFYMGRPKIKGFESGNFIFGKEQIREIYYSGYVSFFNIVSKTAYLTIHRLDLESKLKNAEKHKRCSKFNTETRLTIEEQVSHEDYYDGAKILSRGHFTPNSCSDNPKFRKDTFSTANIAPQVQRSFNDGLWNNLEICTRIWRDLGLKLNVFTGALFNYPEGTTIPHMPNSDVKIPSHFYKIVMRNDENEGKTKILSFIMENRTYQPSEQKLEKYISKYTDIEKMSGIEFFPHLSDSNSNSKMSSIIQDEKMWPGCEKF